MQCILGSSVDGRQYIIFYFKLEGRNNVVSTTTIRMQIVKELPFQSRIH